MGKLEKSRKAFIKAMVRYDGHVNWEYQYSKNLPKSELVRQRNIREVQRTANVLDKALENEIERLENLIEEMRLMKVHMREFRYFPKTGYMGLLHEAFPEIKNGYEAYGDKYLDRKYGDY